MESRLGYCAGLSVSCMGPLELNETLSGFPIAKIVVVFLEISISFHLHHPVKEKLQEFHNFINNLDYEERL